MSSGGRRKNRRVQATNDRLRKILQATTNRNREVKNMSEWFERARKKLFEPNFRRPESPLEQ